MKNLLRLSLLSLTLLVSSMPARADSPSAADRLQQELAQVGVQKFTSPGYKPGRVKHIVLFRYQPEVTAAQKHEILRRFVTLRSECRRAGAPYVVSIEAGSQSSGEGVDQGLEQGFIVTFRSEGDRNYYVGQPVVTDAKYYDPAHQAFKDFVGPSLHVPVNPTGVVVFDFAVEGGLK